MRYSAFIILIFTCAGNFQFSGNAQRTAAYRDVELVYRTAIDLYAKQKYSAAAKHFEDVVTMQRNNANEMVINAKYHVALCHLYLFRKDAEHLLLTFLREHQQASQCKTIYFLLGKHYYQQKRYQKAVDYYTKVDKFDLNESELAEYYFKWAHSNFQLGKKTEASTAFNEIRNTENTYQKPAIYYYSHIAYEEKKYQAALEGFLKLEKEEGFSSIVPYYITQIYYYQGEYQKTVEYGVPLMDSVVPKREAELNLIIGSSYYNLKKYDQAFPYLEKYSSMGAPGRDESYRLGFCALETKQYAKAVSWFNKCVNVNDELAQTAWYHMASAYLKSDKKEEARQTYARCMKIDINPILQEDAHYNYVKLNYELSFNPYHDAINSVKSYFEKYPESKRTEELKTYLVSMFLAGKNYESAYITLNELKNKDLALQQSFQMVAFNLGTDFFYKSDYDKAKKYFGEVKKYPIDKELNSQGHYWIGESNYNNSSWDDAIQGYNRFLEEPGAINSNYYTRAQYNLGYCYMQKGYLSGVNEMRASNNSSNVSKELYAQSLVHFRTFVDNKSEKDNVRLNDALLRIGDIYYIRADNASALTYYDRAYASGMTNSKDYALYQKAMCSGFTDRKEEKIKLMKDLLSTYKQSKYVGDAKFEIAETYRVLENRSSAMEYYKRVISEHPDNFMKVKRSRFEIALIHYRNKDYDLSVKSYKEILKDYPNADDIDLALKKLQPVYADMDKMDEWLALMKQYNKFDGNKAKADTAYFEKAEELFLAKYHDKTITTLTTYLQEFVPARFELQAYDLLARCYEIKNDYLNAALYYEKIANMPTNAYTQSSVKKLAYYYVSIKDWPKVIDYEHRIETTSTDEGELLTSRINQLKGHYQLKNSSEIFNYAKKVLDSKNVKDDDKAEAYYYRAKTAFEQGNFTDAASDFKEVEKLTMREWKAEATFTRIQIKYNNAEYKVVEKDLFAFFKQKPTYSYWTARGFILLADNYLQLGDTAQAKATFKSIIDGYKKTDDEIIGTATQKLDALTDGEQRKTEQRKTEVIKEEEPVEENK